MRKLHEREADVVIGYGVPRSPSIASIILAEAELVALFRPEDLPDAPRKLSLQMLSGMPFVNTVESGPSGRMLAMELGRQEIEMNEVASCRTYFFAAALVRAGVGVTIVDSFTAKAASNTRICSRPLSPPLKFEVQALYLEDRPPSQSTISFLNHLSESLANAVSDGR